MIISCYSDDGEREDSDNDSPRKSGREYRDTIDNINQIGKSTQISVPSANASPARTTRTIKKVDLGAAANYGKEQSNVSVQAFYSINLEIKFLLRYKTYIKIIFYINL